MPTIYTPDAVQVDMIYTYYSQRVENVYHCTKGSPATAEDLEDLWQIFHDWELNTGRSGRHPGCSLVLIVLRAMDSAGAPVYEAAPSPVIAGTGSGSPMPLVASVAIKHTTGLGGRSYRGRSYWIGLTMNSVEDGDKISALAAAALAGKYNTLRSDLDAAGWTFVIVSKYSGVDEDGKAIPRSEGIMTAVTASSCEQGIDTQRHRKMPYQV